MGYRLNRLDEPIFMAVPNLMLTDFDIHYRLESCADQHSRGNDLIVVRPLQFLTKRLKRHNKSLMNSKLLSEKK